MSVTLITYGGFIVAALIFIWASVEVGRRYVSHRRTNSKAKRWVPFNPSTMQGAEETLIPGGEDDVDDVKPDIRTRSRQNGHYSESKKPF